MREAAHVLKMQRFSFSDFAQRGLLFASSVVYAMSLAYCLKYYASLQWSEYGFSYGGVSVDDALLILVAAAVWSIVLPLRIDRPSSLFLIVIYLFVGVPSIVAMVGLERSPEGMYYALLFCIVLAFSLACVLCRAFAWESVKRSHSDGFVVFMVVAWSLSAVILVVSFWDIMAIVSLDEIYAQRSLGAARNLIEGYLQTYFGLVFSPALLVIGLNKRRPALCALGCIGALILYSITAEKAVFMYPLFIIVLFIALRSGSRILTSASSVAVLFAIILVLSVTFHGESSIAAFVAWYLGVRSLLIPGAFVCYYADYFGWRGYTFFSQISGLGAIVERPSAFIHEERWPSLGHMVGESFLGIPTLNANASFIASDGVASLGLPGVFLIFLVFALFVMLLDRVSRGVSADFTLPVLLPLALTLTNGSLFTALTSFGGAFYVLAFIVLVSPTRKWRKVS